MNRENVMRVLSQVMDPDLNRDIVTLGFVKNLTVDGDSVAFDVELTTPACPVKEKLKAECEEHVRSLGFQTIKVNMTARVRQAPSRGKKTIAGVRNVIAVASGKGGVGKSTTTLNLSLALAQSGARVGVLDCDFYGPSLPSMIGLHDRVGADDQKRIVPHVKYGIPFLSIGFMIGRTRSLSWRGPMLHKMLNNFLYDTTWGELDYLILDLPPGTGDVQLSLTQSAPLSGAVLVTTPQEVALRDVEKGYEMFRKVHIPILGIMENMSYYTCRRCDARHRIFGSGGAEKLAETYQIPLLGEIPFDPTVPSGLGKGEPVMIRDPKGPAASAYSAAASAVAAQISRFGAADENRGQWAQAGPHSVEV